VSEERARQSTEATAALEAQRHAQAPYPLLTDALSMPTDVLSMPTDGNARREREGSEQRARQSAEAKAALDTQRHRDVSPLSLYRPTFPNRSDSDHHRPRPRRPSRPSATHRLNPKP